MLDVGPGLAARGPLIEGWRVRVLRAAAKLAWPPPHFGVRPHARGASLAISAPGDQLLLATEVNEWALCAALAALEPTFSAALEAALETSAEDESAAGADPRGVPPPALDEAAAFIRFERLAARDSRPALPALLEEAAARGLRHVEDDAVLTLGTGRGARNFDWASLPDTAVVPWGSLGDIPTALVTGSNGKTTTVRLLAACARARGWRTAYSCTDGVFLDAEPLAIGDYSGPAGTRLALRESRAEAAVLETARGGILRRGIAASQADAAVVTNVSSDHFGEYGIDDLSGLADVKLTVAAVVAPGGLLVLNADDALLVSKARQLPGRFGHAPPIGWFAADADAQLLQDSRRRHGSTCGVRGGHLVLHREGAEHDLGPVRAMPLSMEGVAAYNIANLCGAALAASALGVAPDIVAAVFSKFGARVDDNPGRMMRFEFDGAQVLVDYAHNPDGLRGFLTVAVHLRRSGGRLGMVLGHAGNRQDEDIAELARVAAAFRPDLVVVKENDSQLRGRAPGEVPRLLQAELIRCGLPAAALPIRDSEIDAVRFALAWARPGDVLALPVHGAAARDAIVTILRSGRRIT